jgi:hypothetical protein
LTVAKKSCDISLLERSNTVRQSMSEILAAHQKPWQSKKMDIISLGDKKAQRRSRYRGRGNARTGRACYHGHGQLRGEIPVVKSGLL